ncbi:MAG TPA: ATP-binding cassette domain-containing protein [Baekduia sp.]
MLKLAGVTVTRWSAALGRELVLLDDVSWDVGAGQQWVILGPNGAGKTTLMHLAGAMAQPSAGSVEVLGARLGRVDVRTLRERIGFVDARLARSLRGGYSGLQTVMTGAFNTIILQQRRLGAEHEARALELMALVSAVDLAGRRFEDCSQGERQRLLLARALMADPELLLLDEPASGLDLPGREGLVGALVSLARDRPGMPTVTVTHHLEEIAPTTTHALLLRGGRVLAAGRVEDVLTSVRVSECFGVGVEVLWRRGRWAAAVVDEEDPAAEHAA